MGEIRDETIEDLLSIKGMTPDMVKAVISHPHIFIGDRDAELPERDFGGKAAEVLSGISVSSSDFDAADKLRLWDAGYKLCQQDMADYVKEVELKCRNS